MAPPVPRSLVRTSHALTIKVGGVIVGLINGWNTTQNRTVTPIFEIGEVDSGNPTESMPGNVSGQSVSISRYDIYKTRMEEAFGTPDLTMLTRQNQPFDVMEIWTFPAGLDSSIGRGERFMYQKCWFSNLGRTIQATNDRIVNVTATLIYNKKLRVDGVAGNAFSFEGIKIGGVTI